MISIGLDLSAIDPDFKSHAHRGIGRYVRELQRYFTHTSDPEYPVSFFDHADLQRSSLVDRCIDLLPRGRASARQHLLHPSRVHRGAMSRFSLLHYPAHMDAPAFCSKPYVLTVLDLIPHILSDLYESNKPTWRFKLARWFERKSIEHATMLIAISETTAADLVRLMGIPRERIVVTPLGVDERFFSCDEQRLEGGELRQRLNLPSDRQLMLYVGGHDERKNIKALVGIARGASDYYRARRQQPPLLVLAGRIEEGSERRRLDEAVRHFGMENDLVSLGFLSDTDLLVLYRESSLFLFPTLYEGFGLPALEAMAAGVPVVASNTSSLPEVVGDAGLLFNPLNIEEGTRAVLSILDNPQLSLQLRDAGRQRARMFTWERTGELTAQAYREACTLVGPSGLSAASRGLLAGTEKARRLA